MNITGVGPQGLAWGGFGVLESGLIQKLIQNPHNVLRGKSNFSLLQLFNCFSKFSIN